MYIIYAMTWSIYSLLASESSLSDLEQVIGFLFSILVVKQKHGRTGGHILNCTLLNTVPVLLLTFYRLLSDLEPVIAFFLNCLAKT